MSKRRYLRPLVVAYSILALAMVLGFYRIEAISSQVRSHSQVRQASICAAYDQLEVILGDLISQTSTGAVSEELATLLEEEPSLQQVLRDAAQRNERFRKRANQLLREAECPKYEVNPNG